MEEFDLFLRSLLDTLFPIGLNPKLRKPDTVADPPG